MASHRPRTERKSLRLYEGDCERIDAYFPDLGHTRFIRELVHRTLRRLDERLANTDNPTLSDIPEDLLDD